MTIKTYRVKPGCTFGANRQYKPGDTVQLEEGLAAGFKDKLRLVDGEESTPPQVPDELKNELSAVIPEDMRLIQKDENETDSDAESTISIADNPLAVDEPAEKKRPGRKPKEK